MKPFWKQKTFWAALVSVLLAAPSFVDQIGSTLTKEQKSKAAAAAAAIASVASIFARMGGVAASNGKSSKGE